MKKILAIISIYILCAPVFAIDQSTIDSYNQSGMQVLMGELTGAGSKVNISNLVGFVLADGILLKDQCSDIIVKNPNNQTVSNIARVIVGQQSLDAQNFKGIIIKSGGKTP